MHQHDNNDSKVYKLWEGNHLKYVKLIMNGPLVVWHA